jgi:flagellar biosynthesis/type III secretory pathway chaperone
MSETVGQDREAQLGEYLHLLRQLSRELERGMTAITQNSLTELEDSVTSQQALSVRLEELSQDACMRLKEHPLVAPPLSESGLKDQIRAASAELQQLNHRYSALLHHASHSVALMVSLFSSFQGKIQEGSGSGSGYRTWSCRI